MVASFLSKIIGCVNRFYMRNDYENALIHDIQDWGVIPMFTVFLLRKWEKD